MSCTWIVYGNFKKKILVPRRLGNGKMNLIIPGKSGSTSFSLSHCAEKRQ